MERAGALDPVRSSDDAFCDALVGLGRTCSHVALVIDDALAGGAEVVARPEGDALHGEMPDDLVDAVLGLVSMRTTVELVLSALRDALADGDREVACQAGSPWSREQLR